MFFFFMQTQEAIKKNVQRTQLKKKITANEMNAKNTKRINTQTYTHVRVHTHTNKTKQNKTKLKTIKEAARQIKEQKINKSLKNNNK